MACVREQEPQPCPGGTQASITDQDDDKKEAAAGDATAASTSTDAMEQDISLVCMICGDDENKIILEHCNHSCCLACLREAVGAKHRADSSRCPVTGCHLPLACTDVLRVLAPKDYDLYATRELEEFIQARQKRQENQGLSCCPRCGNVGEMGGGKGKKRERGDELGKVPTAETIIMQECGACSVAFCSLCRTTISLSEAKSTQWPELHQRACPCVLVELNEATRLLLEQRNRPKSKRMPSKRTDRRRNRGGGGLRRNDGGPRGRALEANGLGDRNPR